MKNILFVTLFLLVNNVLFSQTKDDFFNQAHEFFKNNVSVDGKLNYAKLKKSPGELMYILDNIVKLKIDDFDKDSKIAFWINVYNLLVIKNVIENYPLKSVHFLGDFFIKKNFVANNDYSLEEIDAIVKDLIKDPGAHFVLANGSNGGSRLLNSAYIPETVIYQISYQLKTTINKPSFFKIDKDKNAVELPTLFELNKKDFVTQYFNEIDFLNIFLEKKISNKLSISYAKFDWSLNELN